MVPTTSEATRWRFAVLSALACLSTCKSVLRAEEVPAYNVRTWRIVVNDDGEVPIPASDRTLEQFLETKFTDTLGTQVEAYFLCLGSTDRHVAPSAARLQDTMNQWAQDGDVPDQLDAQIRTYLSACRKAGFDVFLSIRMNDIHDAWAKGLTYPLKVKRPDLLIGTKRPAGDESLMNAHWSGFNWAKWQVRKHFYDFIMWCCRKYDFEGVELDWFRHPLMLKLGEEQRNLEAMTGFVRQVHNGLDKIGADRGKPYLLTVRSMDTPEQSLRTGLDVEQWLKEGLLDMLVIGGGYLPYGARLKAFIDMAHRYGVPAYPCMNHFKEPEEMRSVASNFFALGADGFYLFNWYGVEDGSEKAKCLRELGSPETLAGLDKRYLADSGCRIKYCGYVNPPSQFPSPLVGGKAIELVVGDDVAAAQRDGALGRMTLKLTVSGMDGSQSLQDMINGVVSGEDVSIRLNNVQLPPKAIKRVSTDTFVAAVTAPPVRRGINSVRVFPGPHSTGSLAAAVEAMELIVDYKPLAPDPATETALSGPPEGQRVIAPTSGLPLSLYEVPVGSRKTITFALDLDPKRVTQAQLALRADDVDSREELTITLNGGEPLAIPDALLADTGFRTGMIEVPADQLRRGDNSVEFAFLSNLNGTTQGFDVAEALLVLQAK